MNYIVLDLEWNQGNAARESQDPIMPFEIIEIGAVKLDADRKVTDRFSSLIRPTRYQHMHFMTGKLLHLRMEDLAGERTFPEVAEDFFAWCGEDPLFCTWGTIDLTELRRNLHFHGMPDLRRGPIAYLDVQKLFALSYEDKKTRRSLEKAVEMRGLKTPLAFHRAYDDAYYTAELFAELPEAVLSRVSFDCYDLPGSREEELTVRFDDYEKHISRVFEDKHALLRDPEIMKKHCYLCDSEAVETVLDWYTGNGRQFYSVVACPVHGDLKAKLRVKKINDEQVYGVRTDRIVDAEELEAMRHAAEKASHHRYHRDLVRLAHAGAPASASAASASPARAGGEELPDEGAGEDTD